MLLLGCRFPAISSINNRVTGSRPCSSCVLQPPRAEELLQDRAGHSRGVPGLAQGAAGCRGVSANVPPVLSPACGGAGSGGCFEPAVRYSALPGAPRGGSRVPRLLLLVNGRNGPASCSLSLLQLSCGEGSRAGHQPARHLRSRSA